MRGCGGGRDEAAPGVGTEQGQREEQTRRRLHEQVPVGCTVRLLHAHCARHNRPEARASRVRPQKMTREGRVARRRRVVPWRRV